MPNFPSSLDALANPTATTKRNAVGFALATVISTLNDIAEAIQAKLGIGASTPTANTVLRGTGTGSSGWGQVVAGDIASNAVTTVKILDANVTAAKLAAGTTALQKIGEDTSAGAQATLSVGSIPGTYRRLLVEIVGRSAGTGTSDSVNLTFESSPTAAAYSYQTTSSANTTVSAGEGIGANFIQAGLVPAASSTANLAGSIQVSVPNYSGTTFYKTVEVANAAALVLSSGNLASRQTVGVFANTAAITIVRATTNSAQTWVSGSKMTVWGLPA